MQPGPVRGWRLLLGLARAKHRGLFCLHLDAWRARQREPMFPVCWWSHGTDSMAGAGWQGRRSMQAAPGDCQLTGLKCRPSASVGTVCLNPTQEGQRRDRPDAGVYCLPWPDEVSRPACFALSPLPPSAISENRSITTVRAARGSLRTAIFCRRVFWRSGEQSTRIGAGLVCLTGTTALPLPVSAV